MPSDILDKPKPGSPPMMDDDRVAEIRELVRAIIVNEELRATDIARESGIPYGTLSTWLTGKYPGRSDYIGARALRWIETREVRKQMTAQAPEAPKFVMTPTAGAVYALLQHAQHMPDIATFVGAPGIGKTSAACHYTANTPNVWKITANPTLAKTRAVLKDICRVMKVFSGGISSEIQQRICEKVRSTGGLLIIDEAQHLLPETLDMIRAIHDQADIGVALLGNESIQSRLEGDGRKEQFAQLTSRVGMREKRTRVRAGDVNTLLMAWGVSGTEERKLLHAVARRPGALRLLSTVLKLAHMVAAPDDAPVSIAHIRAAFGRVSTEILPATVEEAA